MYRFDLPLNRIHLMSEAGYLKGLMVAAQPSNFCKVYEHVTPSPGDALRFCTKEAAEHFAKALNDHKSTIWNVVDLGPEKAGGA